MCRHAETARWKRHASHRRGRPVFAQDFRISDPGQTHRSAPTLLFHYLFNGHHRSVIVPSSSFATFKLHSQSPGLAPVSSMSRGRARATSCGRSKKRKTFGNEGPWASVVGGRSNSRRLTESSKRAEKSATRLIVCAPCSDTGSSPRGGSSRNAASAARVSHTCIVSRLCP